MACLFHPIDTFGELVSRFLYFSLSLIPQSVKKANYMARSACLRLIKFVMYVKHFRIGYLMIEDYFNEMNDRKKKY